MLFKLLGGREGFLKTTFWFMLRLNNNPDTKSDKDRTHTHTHTLSHTELQKKFCYEHKCKTQNKTKNEKFIQY